ncbi:MAG: DUF1501 domain-containing protein [Planctomycetota bacterium]
MGRRRRLQPGIVYGATDDYGYNIVENPVSVHDLHATLRTNSASTTNA